MMATYRDFIDTLLPGNYALTKSMELTRLQSGGTLWYTKKFLVLYYYVFLSDELETREYISKVIDSFDTYIAALDPKVRQAAEAFFYPPQSAVNFKSEEFSVFSAFAGRQDFENQQEKNRYIHRAKKCYFTLLMNGGGQRGVKKLFKQALLQKGFVYSEQAAEQILYDAALQTAVLELESLGKIRDNCVKYILSEQAIEQARLGVQAGETIDLEKMAALARLFPHPKPRYGQVENDFSGLLRNERQTLYYCGFFHSKSSGAREWEFSSLTPVGELALVANADEFLALWEHQKLKGISQPPTVKIQGIAKTPMPAQRFAVSFTPYTDILGHLVRHGGMTWEQYQYIVSRRKHTLHWEDLEEDTLRHLDEIKATVAGFDRRGDRSVEDSQKELKKYLLGLRADLPFDRGTHPLGVCAVSGENISIDPEAGGSVFEIYRRLDEYKVERYGDLFERCESDLRRRYAGLCEGRSQPVDSRIKIAWELYNMSPDKLMLLGAMTAIAVVATHSPSPRESVQGICSYIFPRFSRLLQRLGIRTAGQLRQELVQATAAFATGDFSPYQKFIAPAPHAVATAKEAHAAALLQKIRKISRRASVEYGESRSKNQRLISLLKAYDMMRFSQNGTLRCECCGKEAFLMENGEPYLEFHHFIPFRIAFGPDHYLNLFALCPDCHRKLHFIALADKVSIYAALDRNNYLHRSFIERLRCLKEERLLRSYHLEYLLAEGAISPEEHRLLPLKTHD